MALPWLSQGAFTMGRWSVGAAEWSAGAALHAARALVAGSLDWGAQAMRNVAAQKTLLGETLSRAAAEASAGLEKARDVSDSAMQQALENTGKAMRLALDAVEGADGALHRVLFENIRVSSVLGQSFAGLVEVSTIKPAFRIDGRDVEAAEVVADFKASGLQNLMLCVPGLFCDETLWSGDGSDAGAEASLLAGIRAAGYYPLTPRFNPGVHISENGRALASLVEELLASAETAHCKLDAITYSQGGLILRSALYYSKIDRSALASRLQRALLVSSPDGGSYLEKLGFWVGLGLGALPAPGVQAVAWLASARSDAIKDLSHGVIREEDWRDRGHLSRYGAQLYFGELDDVDAYQVYSIAAPETDNWSAFWGDGICETPSLTALSDRVYRAKPNPARRVRALHGYSHFQILGAAEFHEALADFLAG